MLFSKTVFAAAALAILSAMTVEAHVAIEKPCPRSGPFSGCSATVDGKVDYDITTPVGTHDSINRPLCK
ncbi:hypothetical protein BGW38_007094, partial [Lunasporangiospora selenospora]